MTIAVFGARGKTGGSVLRSLSGGDHRVRAISRNVSDKQSEKNYSWLQWQAASDFDKILTNCDAAYFMIPTGLTDDSLFKFRDEYSREFYRAANACGVKRVVHLSSFGAHNADDSGVLEGLYQAEQNAAEFTGDLVILRPGYFWQNFAANVEPSVTRGFLGGYPLEPQTRVLFSSTEDIGAIAAAQLLKSSSGHELYYVGDPRLHSFAEVGEAMARALGKDGLAWTNVGYEAAEKHMNGSGFHPNLVSNFISFFKCINSGRAMDDYGEEKLIPGTMDLAGFTKWISELGSAYSAE